jgi:peptidoglycan/LPS O-acetylase OafA/YrhL
MDSVDQQAWRRLGPRFASEQWAPRRLGYRPVLDGVRGAAVLLVMLMHTGVLDNGYVGVDIFFGLSGFLITTLLCEEWERTGQLSFRRFYERRARRLLPALLLVVGIFAAFYLAAAPFIGWPLGSRVTTTLLFVNNWVAGFGDSGKLGALAPTWSLAQEEQFYLIWPLMLAVLLYRRLPPAAVLGILLATIAGLLALAPLVEQHVHSYDLYFSPLDRGAELLLGCAGAVAWRNRLLTLPARWRVPPDRVRRRFGHRFEWGSLLCLGLAGAFAALLFASHHHRAQTRDIYLAANALAVSLIIALLDAPECLLAKLIGSRPLRHVGRISYCLYLCHLLIHNLLQHYFPGLSLHLCALLTFAVSFAIAGASWRLLEARVLGATWPRRVSVVAREPRSWQGKRAHSVPYPDRS